MKRAPFRFRGIAHRPLYIFNSTFPNVHRICARWKRLLDSPIFLMVRILGFWIKLLISSGNVGAKRFWVKCLKSLSLEINRRARVPWLRRWVEYFSPSKFADGRSEFLVKLGLVLVVLWKLFSPTATATHGPVKSRCESFMMLMAFYFLNRTLFHLGIFCTSLKLLKNGFFVLKLRSWSCRLCKNIQLPNFLKRNMRLRRNLPSIFLGMLSDWKFLVQTL